jgi:hypothetical protein
MGIRYDAVIREFAAERVGPENPAKPTSNAGRRLREAFKKREIRPEDFELGALFEAVFGTHVYRQVARTKTRYMNQVLLEAGGSVTTASFMNISGQIVYSAVMEAYAIEDFVFSKLIPEVKSEFINQEKVAGISHIGDEATVRPEGMPYGLAGVTEDWTMLPVAKDRGMIVPITFEAIFSDRTGQLLDQCRKVGEWLGVNKEKRIIDAVIDENGGAVSAPEGHRYNRRGNFMATYGNNSGTHDFDNLEASNALVDWTDLNAAEQLLNGMTDPNTGEPMTAEAKHLIVTKQLEPTARHIIFADQIALTTPGFATSGNPNQTWVDNQWRSKYTVISSRLLAARLATDTDWFLGDLTKAFRYKVIEPLTVVQAPPNVEDEFKRRIVMQFRANEFGAAATVEPRLMIKSTA